MKRTVIIAALLTVGLSVWDKMSIKLHSGLPNK